MLQHNKIVTHMSVLSPEILYQITCYCLSMPCCRYSLYLSAHPICTCSFAFTGLILLVMYQSASLLLLRSCCCYGHAPSMLIVLSCCLSNLQCPMQAGTIFVMTHDSIGLGEDGPTHQPIEHLASFRAMPNILMMRPGDGNETAGCYKVSMSQLLL